MRKARSGLVEELVLGSVERVVEGTPGTLTVGGFSAHLDGDVRKVPWVGRKVSWRRAGTWELGRSHGEMWVDVLPAAGGMSLVTVSVRPPEGWRSRLITTEQLQAAATALAVRLSATVEGEDATSDRAAAREELVA